VHYPGLLVAEKTLSQGRLRKKMTTLCSTPSADYWDQIYRRGVATRSWFQQAPIPSLAMLDAAGVTAGDSVIDVGGGASPLVDSLLARGHHDVTVLDISTVALSVAQQRLADRALRVQWVVTDLLRWQPDRTYRVWHDRAALHFLTDDTARQQYRRVLTAATEPDSIAIIAEFAPEGPGSCSGLPVARYGADDVTALLGPEWKLLTSRSQQHRTPAGARQEFTWATLRRCN